MVASTAYAGFILGPALVGAVASAGSLRVAFAAVAAIAAIVIVALPATRWANRRAADNVDLPVGRTKP